MQIALILFSNYCLQCLQLFLAVKESSRYKNKYHKKLSCKSNVLDSEFDEYNGILEFTFQN